MKDYGFTSAFAEDLNDYLEFKHQLGFYGKSRIWHLQKFDAYCTRHHHTVFDRATVEGWVTHHLQTNTYRSWFSYIRDFGRWLHTQGHDTATNSTSGINYWDLVATRHRDSLTAAPISFADLHNTNQQQEQQLGQQHDAEES